MPKRLDLDESQLLSDYRSGQSVYEIAKKLGASHYAIWTRLRKLGVEMRSSAEQIKMRAVRGANHVEMTPRLREILDGVLLSDGSLSFNRPRTTALLRMEQHPSRREWLQTLQHETGQLGLMLKIDQVFHAPARLGQRQLRGGTYLALRSLNYLELAVERSRWYPQEEKRVPRDLVLTPTTLLHWFCGDGRSGDSKGTLGFCTDGFAEEDVEFLIQRLQGDLGIYASIQRAGTTTRGRPRRQIYVGRRNEAWHIRDLLVGSLPACFQYKLRYVRPLVLAGIGRRLSRTEVELIRSLPRTTVKKAAQVAAAKGVRVTSTTVWRIWKKG